jgi:hypothetical protein
LPTPAEGSVVTQPEDLRSKNGVLKVDLAIHRHTEADGSTRYCYIDVNGQESPTLLVKLGDLVTLNLNELTAAHPDATAARGTGACRRSRIAAETISRTDERSRD